MWCVVIENGKELTIQKYTVLLYILLSGVRHTPANSVTAQA
jgi:hypothetical protein